MTQPVVIRTLTRHTPQGKTNDQDLVAVEAPVSLHLHPQDGPERDLGLLMRTPGDDEDLAAGVLTAEGVVRHAADILQIETILTEQGTEIIRVTVGSNADVQAISDRVGTATSACGLCGRLSMRQVEHFGASAAPVTPSVDAAVIRGMSEQLRERQQAFAQTGGLHAAAVFTPEGELLEVREDVGRHNAVDKILGALLRRDGLPAQNLILAVSGRIAYEIVQKAAMGGLPVIVAVGAPTDLAIDAARECGITLVGFARDERFNVYTFGGRVTHRF
ncbi:MAG: formate dehydrogenase accessory sulfurtransferase FdhD [Vicinamibacterales bacterium]